MVYYRAYGGLTLRITIGLLIIALLSGNGVSATTIIVPDPYARIQWAINNATAGDTIEVHSGTYYENVNVTKQLTLRGIGMPVVNASGSGSAITLAADGIILEGFAATGAGWPGAKIKVISNNNTLIGNNASGDGNWYEGEDSDGYGISLESSSNNTLIGNNANHNGGSNFGKGISLVSSSNNTLIGNNASFNGGIYTGIGISLSSSNNNTLISNNANSHYGKNGYGKGISLSSSSNNTLISNNANLNRNFGIFLESSNNNTLISNNANSNQGFGCGCNSNTPPGTGISLYSSSNNKLIGNNLSWNNYDIRFWTGISLEPLYNGFGISLSSSNNNLIYNNIFNNTYNIEFHDPININNWNITKQSGTNIIGGSYLGGNYWASPDGTGFSQMCDSDADGICTDNNTLNAQNIDHLPLAATVTLIEPVALCGNDLLTCENAGTIVQFNGTASFDPDGIISSYYWEFGDGASSTDVAPNHTYAAYIWNDSDYQPFIVNLTVTDNDGLTNSTSQKVVIWIAGDANGDGKVNILDASVVGLKWNGNDPCADLNNDEKVNILDASIIGLNWGKVT